MNPLQAVVASLAAAHRQAANQPPDRRHPAERRLRELVEVTRLLAWQAQDSAATYDDRGCHESARVLRELAAAADSAIEALRTNHQEP